MHTMKTETTKSGAGNKSSTLLVTAAEVAALRAVVEAAQAAIENMALHGRLTVNTTLQLHGKLAALAALAAVRKEAA